MLVTLNEMKAYLGLSSTTEFDAFLTTQITIVSDAIEQYCNRKFEQADYLQTFYREDFSHDDQLKIVPLAMYPVVDLVEVVQKVNESDSIGVEIEEYRVHKPTGILHKNNCSGSFFSVGDILEVTYSAGYAEIPALITSVVYSIVQERYNKKVNGIDLNFGSDIQRISIPGTIGIDFDYSLQNNERKTHFGSILGNHVNVIDTFRSEQAIIGSVRITYVD
jgi:hypothetical protein